MKTNSPLLIALAAITLMLTAASCGPSDGLGQLYAGGTNGLVLSFDEGAPPDLVYDNAQTSMPILMRVKNDGEFNTRNLQVRFTGISGNDFSGFNELSGVKPGPYVSKAIIEEDVIEGSEAYLDFDEIKFDRSLRGGGSLDYTLYADVCYGYATVATAQVCFETNYNDGDRTCDPKSSELQVSGAPVKIRNLETSAIGGNVLRLSFDVTLADSVEIWAPLANQNCNPPNRADIAQQRNWVYVRVDDGFEESVVTCSNLLGDPSGEANYNGPNRVLSYDQQPYRDALSGVIETDAQGYVRLSDGSSSVSCTIRVPRGNDGLSTIDVALAYFVEDQIAHDFTVVHTNVVDGGGDGFCDDEVNWREPECQDRQ